MYITNSLEGPTMLFCNPNAGFYEFSYYQSEWFEFYQKLGINVMMWNYPGYGRTKGPPSLKKITKSGETIISYLREIRNIKLIGVHGESLGGSIATYLANKCNLNFLFADRTFSSLSQAALYNFGKVAYFGFKIASSEDIDSVSNYLDTKCYKVISSDPKDLMINDLASLKAGVAWNLIYDKLPNTHILIEEHMAAFYKSLKRIYELIVKLSKLSNFQREESFHKHSANYQPLSEDLELFEDERFREALFKLKTLLTSIDAGGVSLLGVVKTKKPEVSIVI